MNKYYEYDENGFYIGWYEAEVPRQNSTIEEPRNVKSRFVSGSWVEDDTKEKYLLAKICISNAWDDADAFANAGMDMNTRSSLIWLAMDPTCPEWRKERINSVQLWWSSVWSHYKKVKESILSGSIETKFNPAIPGPCPYSIWQITSDVQ